jgi:hypothetical protein
LEAGGLVEPDWSTLSPAGWAEVEADRRAAEALLGRPVTLDELRELVVTDAELREQVVDLPPRPPRSRRRRPGRRGRRGRRA